ncbi:MAG: leucine-rich repeat protein, partial [Paludibacteraceae bacterium]
MKKVSIFLCMVLCSIALHANVVTGTCGDNLTWSYDTETKALTIEGTGDMMNYVSEDYWEPGGGQTFTVAPWYSVRDYISSLSLPNGLTSIGSYAFYKCTNLTTVTIPTTVTSICDYAFSYCPLNTISIPNSVTTIGSAAFYENKAVTSVTIGSGVTYIGYNTFSVDDSWWLQENNQLTKTIYTGDLAGWCAIRFGSFYANPAARSKNLYINDVLVNDAVVPANVTKIGDYAFCNNKALHTLTISNGVDSIGRSAFSCCDWITKLVLPESLKSIGQEAFSYCWMDSVTIPSQIKTIERSTFSDCPALKSVTIPEGVTTISDYAFSSCTNLTSITIPSTVTQIGYDAFNSCQQVYLKGTVPPTITDITFNEQASISVPCSAMSAYNAADVWQYMNLYGLAYPLDLSATWGGYAQVLFADCDNSTVTINATAYNNYEYKFSQWSDGNTENPRTLTLTQDTKVTAEFTAVPYHRVLLKGYSLNGRYQYVSSDGTIYTERYSGNRTINVLEGLQVTVSENGSCGNWLGWSDGNTEKYDRVITITSDTVIESLFDAKSYEVSITAGEGGYLDNGDFEGKKYECNNYISNRAIPWNGYYFVGWSNGETDTYLDMYVHSDTTIVARFAEIVPATVVATPAVGCESMGTVTGGGAYNTGDNVTITAVPNEGYHFVEWSDGNGRPERTFRLTSDTTLYATFAAGEFGGKCGKDLYWSCEDSLLTITGTGEMDIYNYYTWKDTKVGVNKVSLPDGLTYLDGGEFYGQNIHIKELIIPATVTEMNGFDIRYGDDFEHLEYLGNSMVTDSKNNIGYANYVRMPGEFISSYDAYPLFEDKYLDTLIISNGELELGYSLYYDQYLNNYGVAMPRYVDLTNASNTTLDNIHHLFTKQLRTLYLPSKLEIVSEEALKGCQYLSSVVIPASVVEIEANAFEDCRSMTSVTFTGNNVETIGDWAFYNCHSLRSLTLPEGV